MRGKTQASNTVRFGPWCGEGGEGKGVVLSRARVVCRAKGSGKGKRCVFLAGGATHLEDILFTNHDIFKGRVHPNKMVLEK